MNIVWCVLAVLGYVGAFVAWRRFQRSRAELSLLLMAGSGLLAVVSTLLLMGLWALLVFLAIGVGYSYYLYKVKRIERLRPVVNAIAIILIVAAGINFWWFSTGGSQERELQTIEKVQRRLTAVKAAFVGDYIAGAFEAPKVLLIVSPGMQMNTIVMESLAKGLKSHGEIVGSEPAMVQPTALDQNYVPMFDMKRFEELLAQYPETTVVVLCEGLPLDFSTSRFIPPKPGTANPPPKPEKELPKLIVFEGVTPDVGGYIRSGAVAATILQRPTQDMLRSLPEADSEVIRANFLMVDANSLDTVPDELRGPYGL